MKKKTVSKKKIRMDDSNEQICFLISPIGKEGTKHYTDFKEILDFIIKPAFEETGMKHKVVRADDINRTGSFIKDILENIYSSYIVIADLTNQNPNVFYELGVRHSLRPRTILIAQCIDDIPSDLREYRTIIYDTTARGAANFKAKIKKFIEEIIKEPDRPDNPVLDRLGSITENKLSQIEAERDVLKQELSRLLSGGKSHSTLSKSTTNVKKRFGRIIELKNGERQGVLGGNFQRGGEKHKLPSGQGNFELYFLKEGDNIADFWYVSIHDRNADIQEELADVRVLLENCSKGQNTDCRFILVVGESISEKAKYNKIFDKMKMKIDPDYRKKFEFELLDPSELEKWEKKFALRV